MPIHDWTRGDDALFHDFQLSWLSKLAGRLNKDVLSSSHFAMTETIELRPSTRFLEMPEPDRPYQDSGSVGEIQDLDERTPTARLIVSDDRRQYACVGITVRHADHYQPVAAILWVTRQDKLTPYRLSAIVRTAVGAITHGIHLLIVDLFPPTRHNSSGIHKAIWDEFRDEPFQAPPGKPLSVISYFGGDVPTAYVESIGIGDSLPSMPIFLSDACYVPAPLEVTYQQAWTVFPGLLKEVIDVPNG